MPSFIALAAMKGRFVSDHGHTYDNFQMLGYVDAGSPSEAVAEFFDQPPFPIIWEDVEYMWAERLTNQSGGTRYGEYERIYLDSLRRRWEQKP